MHAAFSPDGKTIGFSANYEGPTEVYTMPATGGLPSRRTFEGNANVVGWTPDGKILYSTRRYSTLPGTQLATIDSENRVEPVPLSQAAQGSYDRTGATLFFTRFPFQGSYAKRYQGGTAQNIWKYAAGREAAPLTADFAGTSKDAMWWNGRVYFLSDRDGTMNLWSMDENGKSLRQHTRHQGWDLKNPSLGQGRIVYQMSADLRLYDIASGADRAIPIKLASDFDHLREHWIGNPMEYATSANISPDGKWIAHQDKDNQLWLLDTATKTQKRIATLESPFDSNPQFDNLSWSPDSRWLTYAQALPNLLSQIVLYNVETGVFTPLTTDRYDSDWAAWSPDGKWIYFVSDRALKSTVPAPFGSRQPEPYFDHANKIYMLALKKGLRSPFEPADELHPDKKEEPAKPAAEAAKPDTLLEGVNRFEVSGDGKKMLIGYKQTELMIVDATVKGAALKDPKTLADSQVDLKNWTFSVIPSDEFREAFLDAWRLHRDYFYDRNMHGVNWAAMRDKYGELVGRVRDREELSDLIAEMVSELSALHASVSGGDIRRGPDQVALAALGARLVRDAKAGGYLVEHIYQSDPDRPDRKSPLAQPGVDIAEGDVLLAANGRDLLSATDPGELLRNQAGKQVLMRVRPKDKTEPRDVIVKPFTMQQEADLRYAEWEYTRRLAVDQASAGKIGYVHLRAMGSSDINQWVEQYIPVFTRDGLIVDVRHNGGGNIDSWILDKLLRKAWMYWQTRTGKPYWNMQQAFRGHMVVLCDEFTGSDGEAFTEGFRRLGRGKAIGTRTWGGEIWLTASNRLADRGIATAAEWGVFGPDHRWLIEGHGVDPDMVVDNLPHATFEGQDAQLEAAIEYLRTEIREKPIEPPVPPKYPDKSFKYPAETIR